MTCTRCSSTPSGSTPAVPPRSSRSVENTLISRVFVYSLRRLRYLFRVCAQRPYVLAALIYCLGFFYAFAALENPGLITRERTLVLPLLFAVLAIPIARHGERPYPWQVRRAKHRKTRLRAGTRRTRAHRARGARHGHGPVGEPVRGGSPGRLVEHRLGYRHLNTGGRCRASRAPSERGDERGSGRRRG